MSEERGRFASVWIEYADGDKEATVQEAIDVLAEMLHTELSGDVSVSGALNAGPPPWLSTDLSIPRDLAEERDREAHQRLRLDPRRVERGGPGRRLPGRRVRSSDAGVAGRGRQHRYRPVGGRPRAGVVGLPERASGPSRRPRLRNVRHSTHKEVHPPARLRKRVQMEGDGMSYPHDLVREVITELEQGLAYEQDEQQVSLSRDQLTTVVSVLATVEKRVRTRRDIDAATARRIKEMGGSHPEFFSGAAKALDELLLELAPKPSWEDLFEDYVRDEAAQ